jgi:hypothetical protein
MWEFGGENLRERDQLKDLGVVRTIITKRHLKRLRQPVI